ncbi:MAG: ribulose-phosphate 3-epimerase [Candidatus Paceibacteria bacterium]|jgi:ribulose-phosphate 3-epimerase
MTEHPIRIAPSLLSCDFANIASELGRIEQAGADWHHVDVMDGHFVPNITLGPPVVAKIQQAANIPLDVHLMIQDPVQYAAAFAKAGAHVLTFHAEVCADDAAARAVIRAFREEGIEKVGVAVNPATPIERVENLLGEVDLVLVMSVVPGFGGQSFMEEVLAKVSWLRDQGYPGHVEMDGGLNHESLPRCAAAGADVLVAGSAVYGSSDWQSTISEFRSLAEGVRV